MVAEKIKFLTSEVTVKYLEEDLLRIEAQMNSLNDSQTSKIAQNDINSAKAIRSAKKHIKRLDMLILHQADPAQQANFFGLLFNRLPRYNELVACLDDQTVDIGLNELFTLRASEIEAVEK